MYIAAMGHTHGPPRALSNGRVKIGTTYVSDGGGVEFSPKTPFVAYHRFILNKAHERVGAHLPCLLIADQRYVPPR